MRSLSELDDPRPPSASPDMLARVVTTAHRRRRRRRIARIATASGGAAFAVLAAVVLLRADDPAPTVSVPAPTASVPTTEPPATTLPAAPPGLARSADGTLSIPAADGWQVVPGSPYFAFTETEPFQTVPAEAATVATFPITSSPSLKCDLPVSLLDAMGPTDGFISVREVTSSRPSPLPGGFGNNARPPLDDFVPTPPIWSQPLDGRCVAQPDNGTLLRGVFFTENGRFINVYVALGHDADPELVENVKSTLAQLEIR